MVHWGGGGGSGGGVSLPDLTESVSCVFLRCCNRKWKGVGGVNPSPVRL